MKSERLSGNKARSPQFRTAARAIDIIAATLLQRWRWLLSGRVRFGRAFFKVGLAPLFLLVNECACLHH
jgi:hypothetical protein